MRTIKIAMGITSAKICCLSLCRDSLRVVLVELFMASVMFMAVVLTEVFNPCRCSYNLCSTSSFSTSLFLSEIKMAARAKIFFKKF